METQQGGLLATLKANPGLAMLGIGAALIGFFLLFSNRNQGSSTTAPTTAATNGAYLNTQGLPVGPDGNPIEYIPTTGDTFVNYSQTTNTNSGNTYTSPPVTPTTEVGVTRPTIGGRKTNSIPWFSTVGGKTQGFVGYNTPLTITGNPVTGPNNHPKSGGAGSTLWFPVLVNGQAGYVSAWDISTVTTTPNNGITPTHEAMLNGSTTVRTP